MVKIKIDRDIIRAKITQRLEDRLKYGLIEEVELLLLELDELEKKIYRKGEIRDTFSTINSKTDAINTDIFKINNKQDSKIKIKFDIDKNKADWLDKEIKRNGGDKDIMIAIQVVLQKNQKAFLRSWGT